MEIKISPIEHALAKLLNLNGVNYYWKDKARGEGKQMGVIAQEVEAVLPELVSENKDGIKSVDYDGLFPVVVEAIKEQQGGLKNIEERIQALEKQ
ncbi:MAG: tail fiber domain-containing protein [Nitrospinae bacterium]|nr:tail fiber domain-containing protein [Nitrospinota bacterium]